LSIPTILPRQRTLDGTSIVQEQHSRVTFTARRWFVREEVVSIISWLKLEWLVSLPPTATSLERAGGEGTAGVATDAVAGDR